MKIVDDSEPSAADGSVRQGQATRASSRAADCWINGRQFLQRGTVWIDRLVEKMPRARRVRIRFDSREYFQLLNRYPKLVPHFSGARHVHLAVEDTIYEIHE
jgi:hypothetical protein